MTWDELKEEAKKMGYDSDIDYTGEEFLRYGNYCFRKSGVIDNGMVYANIAHNRTHDQMLAIMKALQ